jgi:hypothetical protein
MINPLKYIATCSFPGGEGEHSFWRKRNARKWLKECYYSRSVKGEFQWTLQRGNNLLAIEEGQPELWRYWNE